MNVTLSPALRRFVDEQVKDGRYADATEVVREAVQRMELESRRAGKLPGPAGSGDIMGLAFLVLMESAKSAQEDLKAIMDGVKAINKEKQGWRAVANTLNAYPGGAGKAEFDSAKETIKNKLDSLSEMGEMESLRLQMAMDRMSKMMATLSNLLKKMSDTASEITQNLK